MRMDGTERSRRCAPEVVNAATVDVAFRNPRRVIFVAIAEPSVLETR